MNTWIEHIIREFSIEELHAIKTLVTEIENQKKAKVVNVSSNNRHVNS
jgi:hypothetical protein